MKNILAFDTSSRHLDICLQRENSFFEISYEVGFKHSELLMPSIDQIFKMAEIELKDIDLLVCSRGPGSFTGLRIGMATMKGLSASLNIPSVSVTSLQSLAFGYDYFDGAVLPLLDAKKKRFYSAIFDKGEQKSEDLDISFEDLLKKVESYPKVLLTGPDANLIDLSQREGLILDPHYNLSKGRALVSLGKREFEIRGADPDSTGPLYIRKSEAELSLIERNSTS